MHARCVATSRAVFRVRRCDVSVAAQPCVTVAVTAVASTDWYRPTKDGADQHVWLKVN
jgi:hypothetical protein